MTTVFQEYSPIATRQQILEDPCRRIIVKAPRPKHEGGQARSNRKQEILRAYLRLLVEQRPYLSMEMVEDEAFTLMQGLVMLENSQEGTFFRVRKLRPKSPTTAPQSSPPSTPERSPVSTLS